MPPPRKLALSGGRTLTYDDVGDPAGRPVIYLHGTPDSRLARHPDDGLAARAGVRLLAVDRPGYGGTSPLRRGPGEPALGPAEHPDPSPAARGPGTSQRRVVGRGPGTGAPEFADDLVALLDALELESAPLLAWSGGALDAVRAAAAAAAATAGRRERVAGVCLVAALVPVDAYTDPQVRAAATNRRELLELAETLPAADLAEAVAPLLAPYPCDLALALDHQREQRSPGDQQALVRVPGAVEQMASALVEAVHNGLAGVEADLRGQVEPVGELLLRRVSPPVRLLYGSADVVTPPAFGAWYAHHHPWADLETVDGAGHYLPFTHWPQILESVTSL